MTSHETFRQSLCPRVRFHVNWWHLFVFVCFTPRQQLVGTTHQEAPLVGRKVSNGGANRWVKDARSITCCVCVGGVSARDTRTSRYCTGSLSHLPLATPAMLHQTLINEGAGRCRRRRVAGDR